MSDLLLNALRRNLAMYEAAGMTEHADRMRARIAELDKAAKKTAKKADADVAPVEPEAEATPTKKKET